MVYDSKRDKILMFGGNDYVRVFNDLWEFDYESNTWRVLDAENPPDPRQMHGLVYDAANDVVILYGGRRSDGGAYYNDTWAYNYETNSWRSLNPGQSPPMQDHVNLAYDVMHERTIFFGGEAGLGEAEIGTWAYDYKMNNWSELSIEISPTSDHSSFIYNPKMGNFLLFGNSTVGSSMETWIFDYASSSWTDMTSIPTPSYREHFSMVFNGDKDAFLLVGGYPNHDLWIFAVK